MYSEKSKSTLVTQVTKSIFLSLSNYINFFKPFSHITIRNVTIVFTKTKQKGILNCLRRGKLGEQEWAVSR